MRKWKTVFMLVVIVLAIGLCIKCTVQTGNFSKLSGMKPFQITKITVQTDWGQHKTITSRAEIESIRNILDSARYSRNDFQPDYTGYLYSISFYKDNSKIADIVLGSYPIINGKKYMAYGINIDKIKKIVGLYPPGC